MVAKFSLVSIGIVRKNDKVLIGLKRKGPHPANLGGKWHFPGGVVEKNESPEEALLREIKEETNLEVKIKDIMGISILFNPNWKGNRIYTCQVFYECEAKTEDIIPSSDLVDAKWVRVSELEKYLDEEYIKTLPEEVKKSLNL